MKNKFWLPLIVAVSVVIGILLGWLFNNNKKHNHLNNLEEKEVQKIEKLEYILSLIKEEYVDEVDIDSLIEMTIPHLLNNLDPHSSYVAAKDFERANSELEGKFSGIGISFNIFDDTLTVVEVISGGPAEKKGVMPGDRIIKVDNKIVAGTGITEDDVFSMLRGEKGSTVKISVKRSNSSKLVDFEIVRDEIPVESVDAVYMIDGSTGYIKVNRFARNTYEEFLTALTKLRASGAKDFVIDLRNNGGGYMEPAIMMVNEFLPAGREIVSTRGRDKENDQIILSDGTGLFQDCGLVVLINEFTASASEIFSGAIQDNDRGWIVGRRSFGKGLVQSPIKLKDESEIRLTVQRYYTPSGRCIQKDYKPGANNDYDMEVINRFNNGELLSADSVKLNIEQKFFTLGGRTVYGGGGIMPDYFVPEDTLGLTNYYALVINAGLPMKYAYEFVDSNRKDLQKAKNVDDLMRKLPSDDVLLSDFVRFAANNGIPARWYYINISAPLLVNNLKALIARNIFGMSGYWQVNNTDDNTVKESLKFLHKPVVGGKGVDNRINLLRNGQRIHTHTNKGLQNLTFRQR